MVTSLAAAPTKIRCFCAFRGEGYVHSDSISDGMVISNFCRLGVMSRNVDTASCNSADTHRESVCPLHVHANHMRRATQLGSIKCILACKVVCVRYSTLF